MKQAENSKPASGKNVSWCCNIPANRLPRGAAHADGRPNNSRNLARKRGVGLDCDERAAMNAQRFQAVGKKQITRKA
jgi:hypothetical protein